jgi:hypothetical protein
MGIEWMKTGLAQDSSWMGARVRARMNQALAQMAEATCYAEDLACRPWEFAVPMAELRKTGLSDNDVRWLMRKGYVEHALEVTEPGEEARSFRPVAGYTFSDRVCFVLTEAGQAFASAIVGARVDRPEERNGHATVSAQGTVVAAVSRVAIVDTIPTWDRVRQELRLGGLLVKQYKVPSPNQETVLAAFQEEQWAPRIDDPLPPRYDHDPKRRLHDTINSLNRNQKNPLLRFFGDGSGQGVRWEPWDRVRDCSA